MGKYIGLITFVVLIVIGLIILTYFEIKWRTEDRKDKREYAKRVEKKKSEELKQKNQL